MRNDAHDDLDDLPELDNERIEPQLDTSAVHSTPLLDRTSVSATRPGKKSTSNKALGALSALTLAILCSSAAFAWWSMQRMQLLEQQLIATQDSFSKISEDADGRINAITGKVSATASSVLTGTETLKERLNMFEKNAVAQHKQQQSHIDQQSTALSQLSSELKSLLDNNTHLQRTLTEQQTALAEQEKSLKTLQADLTKKVETQHTQLLSLEETLKNNQQQLAQLDGLQARLKNTNSELAALQKNSANNDELTRLQQDILILRSELEQQAITPAASTPTPSLADFDAYRAQTNRTISALQEQVRDLQKNTP